MGLSSNTSLFSNVMGIRFRNISFLTVGLVMIALWFHTIYVTSSGKSTTGINLGMLNIHRQFRFTTISLSSLANASLSSSSLSTTKPSTHLPTQYADGVPTTWPELFIFRRTKKTGSSSMMNALMDELGPLGYIALPHMPAELENVIRNEYVKPKPRRLMVLHHNKVTKDMHPKGKQAVIIADTLRDGFKHVTGYCRYMKSVKTCNEDMVRCLSSNKTQAQIRYRWAGRENEDPDTYIDLPLASEFPALSTTIIRTVFQNVTLKLKRYNVRKASCPYDTPAKKVYDQLYMELDKQVEKLRRRMLVIAGYPYLAEHSIQKKVSTEDMMRAADAIENEKYGLDNNLKLAPPGKSEQVKDLLRLLKTWKRDENGNIFIADRRDV